MLYIFLLRRIEMIRSKGNFHESVFSGLLLYYFVHVLKDWRSKRNFLKLYVFLKPTDYKKGMGKRKIFRKNHCFWFYFSLNKNKQIFIWAEKFSLWYHSSVYSNYRRTVCRYTLYERLFGMSSDWVKLLIQIVQN